MGGMDEDFGVFIYLEKRKIEDQRNGREGRG
jgi:hypothetical protein